MVNHNFFDLFTQDNVDKQAKIEYSGGVMTNEELFQNSESLEESLCSESELRFGCCEAGCLKFKVANIVKPLMGEWIKYSIIVDHREDSPMPIGLYKVASDKLTADRMHREIVAYDAMYDILNADMAAWYNSILPEKDSTVTLRQFRESFIRHFGLEESDPEGGLVNDDMAVRRTIEPEQISGKDVITAVCEINGCFGHIGRDGKFHYIYLPQAIEGLYPADDLFPDHAPEWMAQAKTGHLYPQDSKGTKIGTGSKIKCTYEDFRTKPITKLQIRGEENDIGRVWPDEDIKNSDNCYIIQDNFLVYGKSHDELGVIASRIFGKITNIIYRPFNAYCAGNPCFEVGDPIRLTTKYDIIESCILKRTLKGVQALRDTYTADGTERYTEKVNGVHRSIIQLKGKTNVLTRTVEETKSIITDVEAGLQSQITQTAGEIRAELEDTKNELEHTISVTAEGTREEIRKTRTDLQKYADEAADKAQTDAVNRAEELADEKLKFYPTTQEMNAEISKTAEEISQTVSKSQKGWAVDSSIKIKWFGFVPAADLEYDSRWAPGDYYLDQMTGILYQFSGGMWKFSEQLKSVQEDAQSRLEQTADRIVSDISAAYETKSDAGAMKTELNTKIDQTAGSILQETSKSVSKWDASPYWHDINLTGYGTPEEAGYGNIDVYRGKTYLDVSSGKIYYCASDDGSYEHWFEDYQCRETKETLQSQIAQTADSIKQEVSAVYETKENSGQKYEDLQSSVEQTAEKIEQKVSRGDVSSEISQEAGKIHIAADRLSIESSNFELTEEGEITSIKGTIGGFSITDNSFGTDNDIISMHKGGDWAIRVGEMTEFGDPGKQYQFCVGHEGNVYCHGISIHEDIHIWGEIYREDSMGVVSLSDKKLKADISPLDRQKSAEFIYSLVPSAYRYKNGTSGRIHHGLVAQEVKESMGQSDWGLYVERGTSEGAVCGLRYEELIADLVATIQTLDERLRAVEGGKDE